MKMDENKAYTLRTLTADDMFPMFQIISKIGIKEFKHSFDNPEIIKAFRAEGGTNIESLGVEIAFDMAGVLMGNLPVAKDSIYTFLASVAGMTKQEIAALPMDVFFEMIIDVIKKDEFKDFFKAVKKLLK
jgi:hypothetical protein